MTLGVEAGVIYYLISIWGTRDWKPHTCKTISDHKFFDMLFIFKNGQRSTLLYVKHMKKHKPYMPMD